MKSKSIDPKSLVTAHVYGDTVEMSTSLGGIPVMQKLNKDEMINRITGKVVQIYHATSRADPKNYESLRATFKRLKRLIGANFQGGRSELWLTLTYKDSPMTDSDRLYKDFKRFIRRLRAKTDKELAYIVVIEPQASGSLHAHTLLKTLDKSRLYIANADVAKAWGQGFVNVRRLKDSDNVGAYLMAYLSDVDLNNLEGEKVSNNAPKKIIKGGRLGLYPVGMQIYRHSRKGIVQATKLTGSKAKIKQKYNLSGVTPDYYRSFDVVRRRGKTFTIESEFYSRKKAELKKALQEIKNSSKK
ncbi:replicative protein [Lactobacillus crispatus]|uniref:rolling circle replication-associated protein n=1 Tax=Lactobacillus crispatus TaxID=47770 RepID=UPI0018E34FD9|nr:replicative protein [Lactobacillus crispatus]MBI1698615.1 replicative protein [Lactobacillus crispatus]